jgi:C4-dicarboxylate transporter, DctM subunit
MIWRSLPPMARIRVLLALLVATFLLVGMTLGGGEAEASQWAPEFGEDLEEGGPAGPGGTAILVLVLALVGMISLGSPLFMILGVVAALCFLMYSDGYSDWGACSTLDPASFCGYDSFPAKMAGLTTKNVLLAIPFFVVSGAIMSAGDIANRLVAVAKSFVGFLPGGLAVASVGGCVFFAAISGSSPVTVIAIGSVMYPALVKAGYRERFAMGLVTSAGSLGIVIPPSIPMLVYAIVAGGSAPIDVGELFMSGIVPGLMLGVMLSIYSVILAMREGTGTREKFSIAEVGRSLRDGLWAILLPVQILGGIYSGLFTPTEAAAVSVVYALVVELFIHRQLTLQDLPKILVESAVMMGSLLVIMALAFGLNDFLVEEKIPDQAIVLIQSMDLDALEFLLVVNAILLVAGALMDSISAIMILAPLIAPIAIKLGVDPIHLGIIFIVNLEIGYLTPPIGLNLFVASSVFNKPLGEVIKSVVPFILILLAGLTLVTYVPSIAMGPVNVILRGKPFYEPLPTGDPAERPKRADAPNILKPGEGTGEKRVLSMQEMTEISEQALILCDVAENVVDAEPPDPVKSWLDGIARQGAVHEAVVGPAKKAAAAAGTPAAFKDLAVSMKELLKQDFDCEELEEILAKKPAG